jgi:hypothetical protein
MLANSFAKNALVYSITRQYQVNIDIDELCYINLLAPEFGI